MTLEKVLGKYVKHYVRLLFKERQGQNMTEAEKLGVAYYRQSAQRVQALIEAPTPAWVGLKFMHPQRTR